MNDAPVGADLFTAEIIRNALTSAAIEMNKTLRRTAYSPLLYDVQDFGVGIVSADGVLWGEAQGQIIFVGALTEVVRSGLAKHGVSGFADGDVLVANDPYVTGTHISDTSVYMPIFVESELVGFAVTTAHWADIGGKSPGGWCPDSIDVYQEGICFNHQRLIEEGRPNRDVLDLIDDNVRFGEAVRGDLDATISACRIGVRRMQALCVKYGVQTVRAAMASTIARTHEAMRQKIGELPDGAYSEAIHLDYDGVTKGEHPRVEVHVTIEGDRLRVSFDGTSPATEGPINLPAIGTRATLRAALKALIAPHDRTNEGHFLAMAIDLPPGLIVSPERPSPCDCYLYVAACVQETTFRALADALPEHCPAGGLQATGFFFFRVDPAKGEPFIWVDPMTGGNGAHASADGGTLMMFSNGDVPNTPVEVAETRFPAIQVERSALRPDVAGAGCHRGGMGVIRDYRVLEPGVMITSVTENTHDPLGKGVLGGGTGGVAEIVITSRGENAVLRERVTRFGLEQGDAVSVRSPGGGGWGPAVERHPEQVADDVRNELLSREDAASIYRVVIGPNLAVDATATARLRAGRTDVEDARFSIAGQSGAADQVPTVR
jgi:N-methylhydantoinase B